MTTAIQPPLTVYRGSAPLIVFSGPTPIIDASLWTVNFYVRPPGSTASLLIKPATYDLSTGKFSVQLTRADTLSLAAGIYAAGLSRTDPGAEDELAVGVLYAVDTARDG